MTPPVDTNTQAERFVFGNYEIVDTTGAGGMGVVYRAIDMQLGRPVALKILRDDLRAQQHIVARFQREAEAIATLNHPNIVHVYSVGSVGKIPYLAMEFIEGTTLGNLLCERGPIPWQEALAFAAPIAEALASAHDAGVIHRDIKPGNILIDASGKAFVTDFGIAKVLGATTKLTVDGSRLGTPQYMSPERCKNKEITPASDIYSLGVLVYQSICGRLPYEANSPVELIAKITGEDPVRITEYVPDIPENVDHLLAHMLDPNPKARPQTARALLTMIERVQQGLPLQEPAASAAGALSHFRVQLEKENAYRTPQPRTPAPGAPWTVRVSRAWFQLSRAARLGVAVVLVAVLAGVAALAAYKAAALAGSLADYRAPATSVAAWGAPATPFTIAQESPGVAIVRFSLPGMRVARMEPVVGAPSAAAVLTGTTEAGTRGQFGLVQIVAEPLSAEMVMTPTPLGEGETALLGAASVNAAPTAYVLSHRGRATLLGSGAILPASAAVAQPVGDGGRWAVARMQAGQWQIEVIGANGRSESTVSLSAGPVTALAVSPDGVSAAFVTGVGEKQVLWTTALTPGASANETARGIVSLSEQAFASDGQRFVAVVKASPEAPGELHVYPVGGGESTAYGTGDYAAYRPDSATILFTAVDRSAHAQLWSIDAPGAEPRQLTFLAAGLEGNFVAPSANAAIAPIHDQPAVAVVSFPAP